MIGQICVFMYTLCTYAYTYTNYMHIYVYQKKVGPLEFWTALQD